MTFLAVLVAGVLYGGFEFFVARGSSANAYLANAVFNGLAALIPLFIVLPTLLRHPAATSSKTALVYNVIAGTILTVFSVMLVKLFASGGSLGYILPTIYGVAIVVGAILGYVFLKEKVNTVQCIGIVVTVIGVGIVAISKR